MKHTIWSAATFQCLFVLVVAAGCGGGDSQPEPSNDAGVISDAGQTFECGSQACVAGDQFCRRQVTAACAESDTCSADELVCTVNGASGCEPVQSTCAALPAGCDQCACLFTDTPCGGGLVNFDCSASQGRIDVRCPQ